MRTSRSFTSPLLLATAIVAVSASVGFAQEPDTVSSLPGIEIKTEVDRAESYVGDIITYSLTITYDSTYGLVPPPLGANLGAFEVKDYDPDIETKLDDGRLQSQTIFKLSTYTTGDYVIPALPVLFTLPDSTRKVMLAEPIPITIMSLLDMAGGDTLDIKPLKQPYDFPPDYTKYILWGGGGGFVLLLAAVLLGWYLWRRKHGAGEPEDPREPWEKAFERLAFIKVEYLDKGIGERPRAKSYYIEMTETIRTYLEQVYSVDVLEMTTEQMLTVFRDIETPAGCHEQLELFFKHADQVKFAKLMPERRRTEDDFLAAHELVDRVRVDIEHKRESETHIVDGTVDPPKATEEKTV